MPPGGRARKPSPARRPKTSRGGGTIGRRARNKEATRTRIVAAALELFQKKGFDATTTKAIARQARVAEGTVFNYFRTKEDIALHFFGEEVEHAMAAVRNDRRLREAPLQERLFALVQSQLEYLAPHERFIGAALVHALRPASALGPFSLRQRELQLRYLAFVEELVEDAVRRGEISPLGRWVPQVFWIYYLGVLLYWLHDASPGKQNTLAFLDRSLTLGTAMLAKR